jgi:hypothetical protein
MKRRFPNGEKGVFGNPTSLGKNPTTDSTTFGYFA